nr:integrase, catalytic region, zinc finger, CCHC-type, peptidase aspartic, catalytic [Tanacetum cinerariifolium]
MLMLEKEKVSNDSKDIQATMEQRIKILENNFKQAEVQYVNLRIQHQKERKMACNVSWKLRMTKLSDENVLLKAQVESVVQERENIKLKFQKKFNSIKATQIQHQQEVNELVKHANQKTYAYADVCAKNQDLLITISGIKAKLAAQAKNVNTKFDKVKRALFTSPGAAKSSKLGATSVVAKSSECSKHMTRNLKPLRACIEKFMGIVCFGNDNFAAITGYGDYV